MELYLDGATESETISKQIFCYYTVAAGCENTAFTYEKNGGAESPWQHQ